MSAMIVPVRLWQSSSIVPIVKSGPIPPKRRFQVEARLDCHAKFPEFPLQLLMGGNGVKVYLRVSVEHLLWSDSEIFRFFGMSEVLLVNEGDQRDFMLAGEPFRRQVGGTTHEYAATSSRVSRSPFPESIRKLRRLQH